ncbi:hypothetical protein ACER0C_003181 [Sarotherodon galilaeus]
MQGTIITERHLNRILRAKSLYRRKYDLDAGIRKENVRILISLLDPVGSKVRQTRRLRRRQYFAQGPNFVWHIASYDKLKPYVLMDALTVIGGYFVEAVESHGGFPRLVRTDMGTENVLVRDLQRYLRRNDGDDRAGDRSYVTGATTANQRIMLQLPICHCQSVKSSQRLHASVTLQRSIIGTFRSEMILDTLMGLKNIDFDVLDDIRSVWNAHRIRPSKNNNVPCGIPDVMHMAPHLWGAEDCLVPLAEDLTLCKNSCTFVSSVPCDVEVFDLCTIIMEESSLEFPSTMSQALDLYFHLRDTVRSQLFEAT